MMLSELPLATTSPSKQSLEVIDIGCDFELSDCTNVSNGAPLVEKTSGKRKSTKNLTIDQFCHSSSAKASTASRIASLIVTKLGSSKKKIAFSFRQTRSCLITVALVSSHPSRPTTPQFFRKDKNGGRAKLGWFKERTWMEFQKNPTESSAGYAGNTSVD